MTTKMSTCVNVADIIENKDKQTNVSKFNKKDNIDNGIIVYSQLISLKKNKTDKYRIVIEDKQTNKSNKSNIKKTKKSKIKQCKKSKKVNEIVEVIDQISFNLSDEDLENSMIEYCGDLFDYEQLEYTEDLLDNNYLTGFDYNEDIEIFEHIDFDFNSIDIEKCMVDDSMDLFCYEQLEYSEDLNEKSMIDNSLDLFCYEQIEDIMDLAEKIYTKCASKLNSNNVFK